MSSVVWPTREAERINMVDTVANRPLWVADRSIRYRPLMEDRVVDVVVIGGGITGVTAALSLKQAGRSVCLLERGTIGSGQTGHTTAHLTCVTDLRLHELVRTFGRDQAALAWFAGVAAIDSIEKNVTDHGISCDFRRVPGYLHASLENTKNTKDDTEKLQSEAELARELGFRAEWTPRVPVVEQPGFCLKNQATFHPLKYLAALAACVDGENCSVHEQTEVTGVQDDPLAVEANGVTVRCQHVVIATHVPLMGKAGLLKATLLQTKLAPYSTYVVSGTLPGQSLPKACLWDTSDPYYYLRIHDEGDRDRVIFGGKDHKTGQVEDTTQCQQELETMLLKLLPNTAVDHRWSGQVIETNDGLPLIGQIADRQFIATGFAGNGMTFGTIGGLMVCDEIEDRENPWRELFSVDRKKIRGGTWDYIKENLDYPYYMIVDRVRTPKTQPLPDVSSDAGVITRIGTETAACARDDEGRLHAVSPVCTHLGCLVHWNNAERTWDCPCHGSRFHPDGRVLSGPAESPLAPVMVPNVV
jgi:glycine/D-amino acid oxidase-like deaminating enzyme/nitrite reductase/ring-hydroxylating ferredoxin subunit